MILSGASLEVKWEPAPDADLSPLTYTVTADGVNVETKHVTTTPGDSSVTLGSLQELTVYNVSVQAVNSGGPSRSLTAAVRMVTVGQLGRSEVQTAFAVFRDCSTLCFLPLIMYNYICLSLNFTLFAICIAQANMSSITGLSFEWADGDFTSLLVRWDPVTAPPGGGVTYHIRHSPDLANDTDMEAVVSNETEDTRFLLTGLDPSLFYSVTVEAMIQDPVRTPANTGKERYAYSTH